MPFMYLRLFPAGQVIFYDRISVLDGMKCEPKFMEWIKCVKIMFHRLFVLTLKVPHELIITIVLDETDMLHPKTCKSGGEH